MMRYDVTSDFLYNPNETVCGIATFGNGDVGIAVGKIGNYYSIYSTFYLTQQYQNVSVVD
jgi:hypothetical protein